MTRHDEMIIAMMARFRQGAAPLSDDELAESAKVYRGVKNTYPGLLEEMFHMPVRAKRDFAKQHNLVPERGETYAELPLANIPPRVQRAVEIFGAKLTKALHYKHVERILPKDAPIRFKWFSNVNIMRGETWMEDSLKIVSSATPIRRDKANLDGQFDYRYNASTELGVSAFVVTFGAFGFFSMVSEDASILERAVANAKANTGIYEEAMQLLYFPPH